MLACWFKDFSSVAIFFLASQQQSSLHNVFGCTMTFRAGMSDCCVSVTAAGLDRRYWTMQTTRLRTCMWCMPLDSTSLGQMMMEACVTQSPSNKQVSTCMFAPIYKQCVVTKHLQRLGETSKSSPHATCATGSVTSHVSVEERPAFSNRPCRLNTAMHRQLVKTLCMLCTNAKAESQQFCVVAMRMLAWLCMLLCVMLCAVLCYTQEHTKQSYATQSA